jgi:hypothetical protein
MGEGKSKSTAAGGLVNITACPQYNRDHHPRDANALRAYNTLLLPASG